MSGQSTVSIVRANTFLYSDKEKINSAVLEAIERLHLPDDFIRPGMNILIKPNLVMDKNQKQEQGVECLYTQPAVVRPVLEYVFTRLQGNGKVVIGDAPMQECVFENLSGYQSLVEEYKQRGLAIELVDMRGLHSTSRRGIHYAIENSEAKGLVVNLGKDSAFYGISNEQLSKTRVTNYDPRVLPLHHHDDVQEYFISEYVLNADVIINLPKPKSHRKAGVTISLKNFVGANIRKEFLPHHTMGAIEQGGDEYLAPNFVHAFRSKLTDRKNVLEANKSYRRAKIVHILIRACSALMKIKPSMFQEGSWYGNNTISKTIVDLNKIVFFCNKNGKMCDTMQRKQLIIADMIISGEGDGPIAPTAKKVGLVAAGTNSVCFDEAICTIMGFNSGKIPSIVLARQPSDKYCLVGSDEMPVISSNIDLFDRKTPADISKNAVIHFTPTSGWKDHIEI